MKRYKLLKDTPTIKAGTIFEEVISDFDELKELVRITPLGAKTSPQWTIQDINNFDEWFEEIKEPVGSIHWKPEVGDIYWYLSTSGIVQEREWSPLSDDLVQFDLGRHEIGNCYRTEKEAEKARDRKLAEIKLRRTSTFKPDFKNGKGGWAISYDYYFEQLSYINCPHHNYGEPVRYETVEDAEKSIKENRQDWLIYFGVEEQ